MEPEDSLGVPGDSRETTGERVKAEQELREAHSDPGEAMEDAESKGEAEQCTGVARQAQAWGWGGATTIFGQWSNNLGTCEQDFL